MELSPSGDTFVGFVRNCLWRKENPCRQIATNGFHGLLITALHFAISSFAYYAKGVNKQTVSARYLLITARQATRSRGVAKSVRAILAEGFWFSSRLVCYAIQSARYPKGKRQLWIGHATPVDEAYSYCINILDAKKCGILVAVLIDLKQNYCINSIGAADSNSKCNS